MITDIIFSTFSQITLERPAGATGGTIAAYSSDGPNYNYTSSGTQSIPSESSSSFII